MLPISTRSRPPWLVEQLLEAADLAPVQRTRAGSAAIAGSASPSMPMMNTGRPARRGGRRRRCSGTDPPPAMIVERLAPPPVVIALLVASHGQAARRAERAVAALPG